MTILLGQLLTLTVPHNMRPLADPAEGGAIWRLDRIKQVDGKEDIGEGILRRAADRAFESYRRQRR